VSSKKDKLIEEAQKLALKGQTDKAIKAYRQIVQQDPSAINQRQKLAELLLKAGSTQEARTEFETIGKYYAGNGFYLKAIAVYKKLLVLYPDDIFLVLTLAELNEKHGLTANALAEYRQVYEYYKKQSNHVEALKVLERMHNADRQNSGIKLMLAEAYLQAGKTDESYSAYSALATLLYEKGDNATCLKLSERISQLFPERSDFMLDVLSKQVGNGNAAGALNGLHTLLQRNPKNKNLWALVIEAFRQVNDPARTKTACQHFLRLFPEDLSARNNYLECLIDGKDIHSALPLLEQYEPDFVADKATKELVALYKQLDQLDPINVRILQGLERALRADGDIEGADAMASKVASLQLLADKHASKSGVPLPEECDIAEIGTDQVLQGVAEQSGTGSSEGLADVLSDVESEPEPDGLDEDIEIDIEVEGDILSGPDGEPGQSSWLDAVEDIFESIDETQRSVKFGSQLEGTDAQSHYDLGLAFKEMGLWDEAISELRQAANDPSRKLACLVLQGACLREKGDLKNSETLLRSLLNAGLGLDDACSVKYDLALTCEATGKGAEAASLLAEIDAAKPGFRDVHARLDSNSIGEVLDFSDDELDDFELK